MIELFKLNHSHHFPSPEFALEEPNGLLAFGGDLSTERLISAYKQGIFPWFGEDEPILWWSPSPRAIIYADKFSGSKSLHKSIRKKKFKALLNHNFEQVIEACANIPRVYNQHTQSGTWITKDMINAYKRLHEEGYAHSVEIYNDEDQLVGGLYGVVVNGIFCGESMFHRETDASKAALLSLAKHLTKHKMTIIDCQLVNPHLQSLGCVAISRQEFLDLLSQHSHKIECWHAQKLDLLT